MHDRPTLSIVLPAFNEEEAIGGTVAQCLAAAAEIARQADLAGVEVLVVNDGSTDRTSEIARSHTGVRVIDFPQNRGYGAALAEGFRHARGELLGFLDADGTCDPRQFGPLCRKLRDEQADLVLGARLGPGSQMPWVRKLGNRFFAGLLSILAGHRVTDIATGMRVFRRDTLDRLGPLPTGLHYTPAMTSAALLTGLRVVEEPIPYSVRLGKSKLRPIRDALRFLRVILGSAARHRPGRLMLLVLLALLLLLAIEKGVRSIYWDN